MESGAEGRGALTLRCEFRAQLSAMPGREDLHPVDPVDNVCHRMGTTNPPLGDSPAQVMSPVQTRVQILAVWSICSGGCCFHPLSHGLPHYFLAQDAAWCLISARHSEDRVAGFFLSLQVVILCQRRDVS